MSYLHHRLTIYLIAICTTLFSSTAFAHPESTSIFATVLGENLTHWLIDHQGILSVTGFAIVMVLFYRLFALKKQTQKND